MTGASSNHMHRHAQNDWGSVNYDSRFDLYWVEAGGAKQQLFYCPWCGEKLPADQRDRWFDELEAMGVDPNMDALPLAYQSGAWRGADESLPPARDRGPIAGRYMDLFENAPLEALTTDAPPGLTPLDLLYTDRASVLRFIACAINSLTVTGRAAYGGDDAEAALTRVNEAIHRLSGHARDLSDPDEPLTVSRVNGIVEQLAVLPSGEAALLLMSTPLEPEL